jgi:hypothetical protein
MKIIIRNNNKIEFTSHPLKDGSNIFGHVDGSVNPETLELNPVENIESLGNQITPAKIYARGGIVSTKGQDKFSWASPDFSAFRDIFYLELPDQKLLLGDNFFDVLSQLQSVTIEKSNIEYFIRLGFFPPGKSFFKEIPRIKIGNKLEIVNNRPIEKSIWDFSEKLPKINYETFKRAISSVISCCNAGDNDAIFLSSGCDSGLVTALIVKKFGKRPLATTFQYTQIHRTNQADVVLIKNIAKFLGIEHALLDSDCNKDSISSFDLFFEYNPLGAYWPGPYLVMAEEIRKRNREKLWAGENADYLYNLGVTSKTLGGKTRRFYLTKEYIKSLPDIKDRTPARLLYRLIGELGNLAWRVKRGDDTKQPRDFQELVSAWQKSPGFIALPLKDMNYERNTSQSPLTYSEAKKQMLERMVQYMVAGRDGRSIHDIAGECGLKPILPYSATNMIHFFRGLELSLIDVFKPKRFIYRYLEELLGKSNYKRLYALPKKDFLKRSKSLVNIEKWQKAVINETNLGIELKTAVKDMISSNPILNKFEHLANFDSTYYLNHMFWLGRMFERVKNMGIDIKYYG